MFGAVVGAGRCASVARREGRRDGTSRAASASDRDLRDCIVELTDGEGRSFELQLAGSGVRPRPGLAELPARGAADPLADPRAGWSAAARELPLGAAELLRVAEVRADRRGFAIEQRPAAPAEVVGVGKRVGS